MPPKGSKRARSPNPPSNNGGAPTPKKPRLDIQAQLDRASILAAQLRDNVSKAGMDSKMSTTNHLATEELVQIFDVLKEQASGASESLDSLITAQIDLQVKSLCQFLVNKMSIRHTLGAPSLSLWTQVHCHLDPSDAVFREQLVQEVHQGMNGFVSGGDYAARIKLLVRDALIARVQAGFGLQLATAFDAAT